MHARPALLLAALAIPTLFALAWPLIPGRRLPAPYSGGAAFAASPVRFEKRPVGEASTSMPLITNVQILSPAPDGRGRVLACDAARNVVCLYELQGDGAWRETVVAEDVGVPARAALCDLTGDGEDELVVAVLGNILPDDGVIGRVEVFRAPFTTRERNPVSSRNRVSGPEESGERHVILDDVRRVADVRPGDFDGDGDLDLAVAVFGYNRGSVLWLENLGELAFREHVLLEAPGTIHVPVGDFDGDGDLDIAAVVTQDSEEVYGFENLGGGEFRRRSLWKTINFDLGSAGLEAVDLDRDGDLDFILPAGDNLEDFDAAPQPYHGCFWLENEGGWSFRTERIATLGGCYAAAAGDLDEDGDVDVALVSMTNDWSNPAHASIVWLENDGRQNFTTWQIDNAPTDLITVSIGDVDGDGRNDVAAGGLHLRRPFDRTGRITWWRSLGRGAP